VRANEGVADRTTVFRTIRWLVQHKAYREKMRARFLLGLCGAAGLVLAALLYCGATRVQGALGFLLLVPSAGAVLLALLFLISLVEIFVMTLALKQLAACLPWRLLCVAATGYVAFAGVYAFLYALLVPDPRGVQWLAALSVARWLTLLLLAPCRAAA
jgi:hypothetical protein